MKILRDLALCALFVGLIIRAIMTVDAHHRADIVRDPARTNDLGFSERYAPATSLELRDAASAPPVAELR